MIKPIQSSRSLFSSLDDLLNQQHPLYKLSHKIHWQVFEEAFISLYEISMETGKIETISYFRSKETPGEIEVYLFLGEK